MLQSVEVCYSVLQDEIQKDASLVSDYQCVAVC